MKRLIWLSILFIFAIPVRAVEAKTQFQHVIVLTAGQVDEADDIEAAIIKATAEGSRPGTVILDGRKGAFVFSGADRSLNMFVSNLRLRGINQAVIKNCVDGLFFDDFPLENIIIEEIAFLCTRNGVVASGDFQDVTVRNNLFQAENNGISTEGASSGWLVTGNLIQAGWGGIQMRGAKEVTITDNHLSGNIGISLLGCSYIQVLGNSIDAKSKGVLLGEEAWKNMVKANTIVGVSEAGISLDPGVIGNKVWSNWVICALGSRCLTVEAMTTVVKLNSLAWNRP